MSACCPAAKCQICHDTGLAKCVECDPATAVVNNPISPMFGEYCDCMGIGELCYNPDCEAAKNN